MNKDNTTTPPSVPDYKPPTIPELLKMELDVNDKEQAFNVAVNQDPPKQWIKNHPIAKSVKYIPIDKIEYMLTRFFIKWWVEVKNVQTVANSAVVTVRLNYTHPINGDVRFQEGIGAAPIHTDSGAGAMDWNAVKADSVMKAVPAAETYAIKDAAEKIGRIFGKDLNRKDIVTYNDIVDPEKFKDAKITEK